MIMPANLRSEIEMCLLGFSQEHSAFCIAGGHGWNHTSGVMALVPSNHTPPTPHFEASMNPWKLCVHSTSLRTWIGQLAVSRIKSTHCWRCVSMYGVVGITN